MNALVQICELLIAVIKRLDLIDLPFLALAVATQRPAFIALFILQFLGRRWPPNCKGILQWCGVQTVEPWHCKVLPGAAVYLMSNEEDGEELEPIVVPAEIPATTMFATPAKVIAIDNNERNALLFAAKADALAAMVHAGKVKETEGIKIVYGVSASSSNKTYLLAREMLHARLARLAPEKYDRLTSEQEALRVQLGLHNTKKA